MLLLLICAYKPNTVGVIVRLKGSKQIPDTFKQVVAIINWLGLNKDIRYTNKSEWDIVFHNGSTISLRSVYDPQGNVAMKGVTREMDAELGIVLNEECNTFTNDQLIMAEEAISADKTIRFDLFNTDHVKQYIVNEMQEVIPVNMTIMKTKGFQQRMTKTTIKNIVGEDVEVKTWWRRSNHIPIKDKLKDGDYKKLMRLEKQNPERAKVAVWGDNGATGTLLFPALTDKNFINPIEFGLPEKLPARLFKRYRIGIDTAEQKDDYVMTLTGVTHQNRLIPIEVFTMTPQKETELLVEDCINNSFEKIIEWGNQYQNMPYDTRIRVETAGNGTAVRQKLEQKLLRTNWTFTIDKCKKSIEAKNSKGNIGSVKGLSQPQLEERTSAENSFFASKQKIFYNLPRKVRDQYETSRNEDGTINTNGGDDIVQAFQYGEMPEYENMWENPPRISFREELLVAGVKF